MYSDFIKWVDMDKWNSICSSVYEAKVLNESSNRMLKEKYILAGLLLSNTSKNIKYVDLRDYDLLFKDWKLGTVEVKSGDYPMFSRKQFKPKSFVKLKLKNNYENKHDRQELGKEFDHLMVIQLAPKFTIAFVDYATAIDNMITTKDGFISNIPIEKFDIVYCDNRADPISNIEFNPMIFNSEQYKEAGL